MIFHNRNKIIRRFIDIIELKKAKLLFLHTANGLVVHVINGFILTLPEIAGNSTNYFIMSQVYADEGDIK